MYSPLLDGSNADDGAKQNKKKMLRTLIATFSIMACVAVLYLSVNTRPYPTISHFNGNLKILEPLLSENEPVQMRMTTPLPAELADNPRLSADFLKGYYERQATRRANLLKSIGTLTKFSQLYNGLVPEVYCPDLVRVGNVDDGGKWVCNPVAMPKENCSIYSLGLRNDISFDSEIQEFNNNSCRIYGYDAEAQNPMTVDAYSKINGVAKKMKIVEATNSSMGDESTLEDLYRSHGDTFSEFLKMDIEGYEHATLPRFLDSIKVCQIFLEMHGESIKMRDLLVKIAEKGYFLYFYEVNGDNLSACEFSFIHEDCMQKYGVFMLAPYLRFSSPYPTVG